MTQIRTARNVTHSRGIAAVDLLLKQVQFMLLDAQLARQAPPFLPCAPRSFLLALKLRDMLLSLLELAFCLEKLLYLEKDAGPRRCSSSTKHARGVVNVAVERD